jgi:hypothetical protein
MRRPFTATTCALALASVALMAQNPPAQTQPPAQPPAAPSAPKLSFTGEAGLLLVQIKPDQTATFEEMIAKLKAGAAKTEDASVKSAMTGWKVYKSAEGMQGNALYVVMVDPVVKDGEYELFSLLGKVMTPDEVRAPATVELFKKFQAAFAAGYNKLNLSPVGGG